MGIFSWIEDFRKLLRPADDGLNHQYHSYPPDSAEIQQPDGGEDIPAVWSFANDEGFHSMFQQMEAMLKDMEGVFQTFPSFGSITTIDPNQNQQSIEGSNPRDQMLKPNNQPATTERKELKIPEFQFEPNSRRPDEDLDSRIAADGIDAILTPEDPRDKNSLFDWFGGNWVFPSHRRQFELPESDGSSWSSSSISTSRQHRHYPDGRIEERVVETREGGRTEHVTRRVGSSSCRESVTVGSDGQEHRQTTVNGTENNTVEEFERLWSKSEQGIQFDHHPRLQPSLFDKLFPFRPKS